MEATVNSNEKPKDTAPTLLISQFPSQETRDREKRFTLTRYRRHYKSLSDPFVLSVELLSSMALVSATRNASSIEPTIECLWNVVQEDLIGPLTLWQGTATEVY